MGRQDEELGREILQVKKNNNGACEAHLSGLPRGSNNTISIPVLDFLTLKCVQSIPHIKDSKRCE